MAEPPETGGWADRGWWLAVEYGVLARPERFEKRLEKLRRLGLMKELLEPGGRIVYRNLFREDQVREAWTLLCELTPWKAHLHFYLQGEEIDFKQASDLLWCAGFLRAERPCLGFIAESRGSEKRARAWTIGCERRVTVAPVGFDEATESVRHALTFSSVDARGTLSFDREKIAAFFSSDPTSRRCPLAPARDPAKLAEIFRDVSVRSLGWPLVLEMSGGLRKKLGAAALEAEHGFVAKKGAAPLEEHAPIELRAVLSGKKDEAEIEVRRALDLRAGTIARQVRLPRRVESVLALGFRLRGVRLEESYVKMADLGGRYDLEQRFVLSTRFHLGPLDDPASYEGYSVVTVPRSTPEYARWAGAVMDAARAAAPVAAPLERRSEK